MPKSSDPSIARKHKPAHVKKQQAKETKKKKAKVHPLFLTNMAVSTLATATMRVQLRGCVHSACGFVAAAR